MSEKQSDELYVDDVGGPQGMFTLPKGVSKVSIEDIFLTARQVEKMKKLIDEPDRNDPDLPALKKVLDGWEAEKPAREAEAREQRRRDDNEHAIRCYND